MKLCMPGQSRHAVPAGKDLSGSLSEGHDVSGSIGVLSFAYHGSWHRSMCVCDQSFLKTSGPDTELGFPGQRPSTRVPVLYF